MTFLSHPNDHDAPDCPTNKRLEQFLQMSLVDDDSRAVARHVEQCCGCQARVDELTSSHLNPETLGSARLVAMNSEHVAITRRLVTRLCNEFGVPIESPSQPQTIVLGKPVSDQSLGTLKSYVIRRELGTGATATVYEAVDSRDGQRVAIKLVRSVDEHTLRRARREAEVMVQTNHEGLVAVHAVDVAEDGRLCLVMPFVDGVSLSRLIHGSERLTSDRIAELIFKVADALEAVHQLGILHRDVKPSNILVDQSGTPKLTDFGAVAFLDEESSLTVSGTSVGTPCYMSPEQAGAEKNLDARTDVYSLGATMYECLTKTKPFQGSTLEVIRQVLRSEPVRPRQIDASIPWELEAICLKALAKERSHRYRSAREIAEDLKRWRARQRISARPLNGVEQSFLWVRRNKVVSTLLACLTLSILIGMLGVLWNWRVALNQRDLAIESLQNNRRAIDRFYLKIGQSASKLDQPGLQPLRQELLTEAVSFYRDFIVKWPNDPELKEEMANAYCSLAEITESLGNANKTIAAWHDAELATQSLLQLHPDSEPFRIKLYRCQFHRANGLTNANRLDEAIAIYREVHATLEAFHTAYPTELDYRRDLASCVGSLGNCLLRKERNAEAAVYYRRACDLFQQLHSEDPENNDLEVKLATTFTNLALCVGPDEQISAFEAARPLLKHLYSVRAFASDARRLAKLDLHQGVMLCTIGREADAIEHWQSAIQLLAPYVQTNPDVIDLRDILGQLYFQLGLKLESPAEAIKALSSAQSEQEWMCQANPQSEYFQNQLKETKEAIQKRASSSDLPKQLSVR